MTVKMIQKAISCLPHVYVVLSALMLAVIFWGTKTEWPDLKLYQRDQIRPAGFAPDSLVWKQPILPPQYAEGSCGTCHRADLAQTPHLNHGRQLIVKFNCIACHQLQDVERSAMLGPDLTNVGTKVTREWIYKWLKDPRTLTDVDGKVIVDGIYTDPRMPRFQLSDHDLRALSAYLSVQRAKPLKRYSFGPRVLGVAARNGNAADQGQVRFNEMFCVTCHALAVNRGGETTLIGGDIGPELTKVGTKVKPEWLTAWLHDPEGYLQHTKMPRYQWSDETLFEVTQYILTRLTDPDLLNDVPALGLPTNSEVQRGHQLFVEKGCAECHVIQGVTPRDAFGPDLSAEGMAAGPYLVEVRSAHRLSVPLHFVKSNATRLQIRESLVSQSMIAFIQAKITNPGSVTPETHMPEFHMSKFDLDDLTTALLSMTGSSTTNIAENPLIIRRPQATIKLNDVVGPLIQRYKCYTCHMFNGYGGTLAPDLSYEGSRARHEWLTQFLKSPQTLRPALTVRMPRFNMPDKDAVTIANYLSSALQHSLVDPSAIDDKEFTAQMATRGKELFETKYACQSCHTIGSSGGYVGPSLSNVGNWMTPAWIEAWLYNPQALVPGAIEPRHSFAGDEIKDLTAYLLTLKQAPTAGSSSTGMSHGGQQ